MSLGRSITRLSWSSSGWVSASNLPDLHDLAERGVTAPGRAGSLRPVRELGFVGRTPPTKAYHFGDQIVRPVRQPSGRRFPLLDRPLAEAFRWYADDHARNRPRWDPTSSWTNWTTAPWRVGMMLRRRNVRYDTPLEGTMEIIEYVPKRPLAW